MIIDIRLNQNGIDITISNIYLIFSKNDLEYVD